MVLISCFLARCTCLLLPTTVQLGAGLFSVPLYSEGLFTVTVEPSVPRYRCSISYVVLIFTVHWLVSSCCSSGEWCVAPAIVPTAPVTAAALLLSWPRVANSVFDVKHLDGSNSASGLSFTASHWPGQKPCQRNTADITISYSACMQDGADGWARGGSATDTELHISSDASRAEVWYWYGLVSLKIN